MQNSRKNQLLKRQREQRQLTQEELAEAIGTTEVNVSRWENGTNFPGPYYRRKLCAFFGVGPEELGLASPRGQQSRVENQALPSFWNVPYRRNPLFTGREDILQRIVSLRRTQRVIALTQAQALSGLGGIGKTQAAVEYAYRHRYEYRAVLWVRADSRESILSDFIALAHLLALPEKDEQEQNRIVESVKRWLAAHTDWLLILDNADDLQVASDYVAPLSKGHILLTTRMRNTGPFAQSIEIPKFGREESIDFLLGRAGLPLESIAQAERDAAEVLVQQLDGLPLALDQAGAYIQETACGLSGYLDRYRTRGLSLLGTRDVFRKSDHPDSVAITLALSFARVEQASPSAAELLRLCAFLHPDAIPEEVLTEGTAELGPILGPVAADQLKLDSAIGELRRLSLLERNASTNTLTVHRLVQAVLQDDMEVPEREAWTKRAIAALNAVFPQTEQATWDRCERLVPHVLVCASHIDSGKQANLDLASLLSKTASYFYERARYAEAEPLFLRAVHIMEQVLGSEHPDLAYSLNGLAAVCKEQGKYAAAELLYQRALHIREQALGPEHPRIAYPLNNLAVLYTEQGKYAAAEPLLLRALRIWEQASGPEHPDVTIPLNGLAILYVEQGKYAEAESLYQRMLRIWEQASGTEHLDVAYPLIGQAVLYFKQGRYAEAESLFLRALRIWEQALGPEHPHLVFPLNGLAVLYKEQGRFAEAEQLFLRALTIREGSLGQQHPGTAETLHDLAAFRYAQGNLAHAASLYQRALTIREQSLGYQHPQTAKTRTEYAAVLRAMGEHGKAALLEATLSENIDTTRDTSSERHILN